jgi:peptidoglycan hydrolase-like protein with peptidoglycan-binding domain
MSKLFNITEDEKSRILSLHESTSKKTTSLSELELKEVVNRVLLEQSYKDKVTAVQQELKKRGYDLGTSGPNKDGIDGVYGDKTRLAVTKFQKDNAIKQTGNVGDVTSRKLGVAPLTTQSGSSQQQQQQQQQTTSSSPFATKEEGDKFRKWFNDKYGGTARQLKLDRTGSHTNDTIKNAFNKQIKGSSWTYGKLYQYQTRVQPNQSKASNTDPSDINSYPSCVRFSKPSNDSAILNNIANLFGSKYGNWFIPGTGFYEGYSFFKDGSYVSVGNSQKGTYFCNENNKLILDIAAKATDPTKLSSGQYEYSPRIDAEVQHIKNRNMDDTPFFVYDPKDNLIYLFNTGGKYVAHSSVVDGESIQKELSQHKAFSAADWCKISGNLGADPHVCTDPKTGNYAKPHYGTIARLSSAFLPKGIYTIDGLSYTEGYAGDRKNTYSLEPITLEGTVTTEMKNNISPAIHGIPNIPERLTASTNLEEKLRADLNNGKVPKEYIASIQTILAANQSSGCIGIPESFVNNPKVYSIVKDNVNNIKVFAMGEDTQDFLAKKDGKQNDNQRNFA